MKKTLLILILIVNSSLYAGIGEDYAWQAGNKYAHILFDFSRFSRTKEDIYKECKEGLVENYPQHRRYGNAFMEGCFYGYQTRMR